MRRGLAVLEVGSEEDDVLGVLVGDLSERRVVRRAMNEEERRTFVSGEGKRRERGVEERTLEGRGEGRIDGVEIKRSS